jgi:hypothetical protein
VSVLDAPESVTWQIGLKEKESAMVENTPCTLSFFMMATVNRTQNTCHLWIFDT